MKLAHKVVAGVAAFAIATALSACGSGSDDDKNSSSADHAGGDLVHVIASLGDSWQQQDANNFYDSQVWAQLTETLVYVDEKAQIHPWLATDWTVGDDGLQYDLTIRDGVTFSDGTELTAQIVADNLNLFGLGDEARGINRVPVFAQGYKEAVAVDDSTVRVTLTEPDSGFLVTLGYQSTGILAPSTIEASREEQSRLENVIGTGPFVLDDYTPEQEVVLKKREGYDWAWEGSPHTGEANLDSVTFRVVPEDGVRLGAVESGQANSLHYVPPSEEDRLSKDGYTVINSTYSGVVQGLAIRLSADIVDDVSVRRAIQHGIDRQDLIDTLYSSNWKAATSIWQNLPGVEDISDEFAFDPDQSKSLLDDAGWSEVGKDGIRVKDGKRLSLFVYPTPFLTDSSESLQLISQHLEDIGIELKIRSSSDANFYTKAVESDDLPLYVNFGTGLAPSFAFRLWHSERTNGFRSGDAQVDTLLEKISATLDDDERAGHVNDLARHLVDQAYFVPLIEGNQVFVAAENVHDVVTNAVAKPFFYSTWIDD